MNICPAPPKITFFELCSIYIISPLEKIMPESRQVQAEGGAEYWLLNNNDHQDYTLLHHSKFDVDDITADGFTVHYCVVRCEEIRTKHLPNSANPRDPSPHGVVHEMQRTLQASPEKFYQYNGGITIACSDFEEQEDDCRITFGAKDGIANGGHTYFSIQTYGQPIDDMAVLQLEVLELPEGMGEAERREVVGKIAQARNKNRELKTGTQLNHRGHFDLFKQRIRTEEIYADDVVIPNEWPAPEEDSWVEYLHRVPEIYWYEGDNAAFPGQADEDNPDRIKSSHFIRLLASLDPCLFKHPVFNLGGNGTHGQTVTGDKAQSNFSNAITEAMEDPGKEIRKMRHMAPLAHDILRFRDHISHELAHGEYPQGYRNSSEFRWFRRGADTEDQPLRRFTITNPDDLENGLNMPPNAYPLVAGLFRHNVWIGKDDEDTIEYSGWYEYPWDTLYFEHDALILRHIQFGTLKNLMDAGDDDAKDFIRNNAVYQNSWLDYKVGMQSFPKFPVAFYAVSNYRLKYTKVEPITDATHYMTYPHGQANLEIDLSPIAEYVEEEHEEGDVEFYLCDERRELIPDEISEREWEMKLTI